MANNTLPKAPKHRGIDPLTTGKTLYGPDAAEDVETKKTKSTKKTKK